jgi:hypothetical protein
MPGWASGLDSLKNHQRLGKERFHQLQASSFKPQVKAAKQAVS